MVQKLTSNAWIAGRVIWWTVADGLIGSWFYTALGVGSAFDVGTRVSDRGWSGAQTALLRVAYTARLTCAFVAAYRVGTDGIRSARVRQTFVDILFTFDLSVSVESRRAEALSSMSHGSAHGVGSAGGWLEARLDAAVL